MSAWNRGSYRYMSSLLVMDKIFLLGCGLTWAVQNIKLVWQLRNRTIDLAPYKVSIARKSYIIFFLTLVILPCSDYLCQGKLAELESFLTASHHSALVFPILTIQAKDRSELGTYITSKFPGFHNDLLVISAGGQDTLKYIRKKYQL